MDIGKEAIEEIGKIRLVCVLQKLKDTRNAFLELYKKDNFDCYSQEVLDIVKLIQCYKIDVRYYLKNEMSHEFYEKEREQLFYRDLMLFDVLFLDEKFQFDSIQKFLKEEWCQELE